MFGIFGDVRCLEPKMFGAWDPMHLIHTRLAPNSIGGGGAMGGGKWLFY